jgi:hypothetical protein
LLRCATAFWNVPSLDLNARRGRARTAQSSVPRRK